MRFSSLFTAGILSLVTRHAFAQAPIPSTTRPATCLEGLREYHTMSEVPIPHDTVRARLAGDTEGGMMRIDDLAEFRRALLRGAAAAGATGYVSFRASGDVDGSAQNLGRTLPVFVPADSARARAACTEKVKTPRPSVGQSGLGRIIRVAIIVATSATSPPSIPTTPKAQRESVRA